MDCLEQSDYDHDFYGVFIQELNETLNTPRLNLAKYPGFQVPMMFWTDHDCYLLMELARTSPEMIETLPKLKVASDPGSTEFFYDRLRAIAHAAKIEAAACGGNYAVIRKFSDDLAHKVPMPWHAPGWEMHCKYTESITKPNSWQFPHQRPSKSTLLGSNFPKRFDPSFSYLGSNCVNETCEERPVAQAERSAGPLERSVGQPERPAGLSEDFLRSQDEFFMGTSRPEGMNQKAESLRGVSTPDSLRLPDNLRGCVSMTEGPRAFPVSSDNLRPENLRGPSMTEGLRGFSVSESLRMTWPKEETSGPDFTSRQGRYWPRQSSKDNNFDNNNSCSKMGEQFPAYVRPSSSNNVNNRRNHYYCKVQNSNDSESSSPSTPRESYLCVFCKGNNEPEAIYKSHPLRLNNIVICPSLRNYTCCICKATGDNAHTIKYCPYNKRGYFATRSHEKCNSNNNSRLKMKVQIIDDEDSGFAGHNYQGMIRSYDEEDEAEDVEDEDSPMNMISGFKQVPSKYRN